MSSKQPTPFDPGYESQIRPFPPRPFKRVELTQPPRHSLKTIAPKDDEGKRERLRRGANI